MRKALIDLIAHKKIIAICRGIYGEELLALAAALERGGVHLIEVTFDQSDVEHLRKTSQAIAALSAAMPGMAVGAGTVITQHQLEAARESGARYIISPNTDISIIAETKRMGLVSIPGAMTPSEIVAAWQAGADFVKLFPCAQMGLSYIKSVCSPLNHIPLIATGGIDENNLADYLSAGMLGAGMGGKLCDKKLIREKSFAQIEASARKCAEIAVAFGG
jgi:2-dehydro-3-deoxyphosphogluconate aldolase/(4S)-4-hydroxy-2-oxoglutarate aldolase